VLAAAAITAFITDGDRGTGHAVPFRVVGKGWY
jgi:hypothetical protein